MNNLLAKLKPKPAVNMNSPQKQQHHDYHVIDERVSTAKVSPSNSVESFEFINHNMSPGYQGNTDEDAQEVKCYEKSWENTAVILMEKLDKCLKDEQQQHLQNKAKILMHNTSCNNRSWNCVLCATPSSVKSTFIPIKSITPIKLNNCSLRDKRPPQSQQSRSDRSHRNSFPFKKSSLNLDSVNIMAASLSTHRY